MTSSDSYKFMDVGVDDFASTITYSAELDNIVKTDSYRKIILHVWRNFRKQNLLWTTKSEKKMLPNVEKV